MKNKIHSLLLCFLLFVGCSDTKPFLRKVMQGDPGQRPDNPQVVTFYALGDWGTGDEQQKAVAAALKENVAEISGGRVIPPFVLGLGDNVYNHGLPERWNNPLASQLLKETFGEIYKDVTYDGKELIFHIIPGNHDHAGKAGGKQGWGDVIHQETTAENLYNPYWKYYPIDPKKNADTNDSTDYYALKKENIFRLAFPEKMAVDPSNTVALVAIDTQVLLQLFQKKNSNLIQRHWQRLRELLHDKASWKIVVGHHPLRSHGRHGGFRPLIEWTWSGTTGFIKPWWIRPLTFLWLPFFSTSFDKLFYKRLQDLDSSANKKFQNDLFNIMKKYQAKLYLSGHEHNLQFLTLGNKEAFQIISGSAGKLSPVTHKDDTLFSHAASGFIRFDATRNELWVEFFAVDIKHGSYRSTALFRLTK